MITHFSLRRYFRPAWASSVSFFDRFTPDYPYNTSLSLDPRLDLQTTYTEYIYS